MVGKGQGVLIEVNQEGIWRRDFEDRLGLSSHVRKINVKGTTDRSRI